MNNIEERRGNERNKLERERERENTRQGNEGDVCMYVKMLMLCYSLPRLSPPPKKIKLS